MIAEPLRKALIELAVTFGRHERLSLEQLSSRFYGNTGFFRGFRAGKKTVSLEKYDEMVVAMREAWPSGQSWPLKRISVDLGSEIASRASNQRKRSRYGKARGRRHTGAAARSADAALVA